MTREEMSEILKKNIDLETLMYSREGFFLRSEFISLKGFPVTIDGDIDKIIIYGKNRIALDITYSIIPNLLLKVQRIRVFVDDEKNVEYIRKNILPNTRIKIIAKFHQNNNMDLFDLVSIIDYNNIMKFGYYICSKCGTNYGRESEVDPEYPNSCCICADDNSVHHVNNFYAI